MTWTKEIEETAIQRREEGASIKEIARELGVSRWLVAKRFTRMGLTRTVIAPHRMDELKEMCSQGLSIRSMAIQFGVSDKTINRIIRDENISYVRAPTAQDMKPSEEDLRDMIDEIGPSTKIAAKLGVHPNTVRGWIWSYGIRVRPTTNPKTPQMSEENIAKLFRGRRFEDSPKATRRVPIRR